MIRSTILERVINVRYKPRSLICSCFHTTCKTCCISFIILTNIISGRQPLARSIVTIRKLFPAPEVIGGLHLLVSLLLPAEQSLQAGLPLPDPLRLPQQESRVSRGCDHHGQVSLPLLNIQIFNLTQSNLEYLLLTLICSFKL